MKKILKTTMLIGLGVIGLTSIDLVFENPDGEKNIYKYKGFLRKMFKF